MRYGRAVPKLCLTRRVHEALYIGENVRITVGEIRGNQVRLYIEAPADVLINREERLIPEPKNEPPKM